jgi:GNAT superfamily N-acetyltransferase
MQPHDDAPLFRIFQHVLDEGATYVQEPSLTQPEFVDYWKARGGEQWVAEAERQILGGYTLRANHAGRGAHVATASYIVDAAARGHGVGRALGEHSLERARALGFTALQFNLVVSTNEAAVQLWQRLGLRIVATLPRAFRHAQHGLVDAYVMYREL